MRAGLLDSSGDFMAENSRRSETVPAFDHFQVRVAHAARCNLDKHILLAHLRHLQLFDSQRLARFVQYSGFHRYSLRLQIKTSAISSGFESKLLTPVECHASSDVVRMSLLFCLQHNTALEAI